MTDYEMLKRLPKMSFRGIALPIVDRVHDFGQMTNEHTFIYRDGVTTEMLGVGARRFTYAALLRESITVAGYKNLFSSVLRKFYEACLNPEAGPLIDPVHGEILCTPGPWHETTDHRRTDGVDVQISFVEYTAIGEQVADQPPTIQGVYDSAKALDVEVAATKWTQQVPSPEATVDPLSGFAGLLEQTNTARERFDNMGMSVSDKALKVERAAEKLGLAGEPARRAARKLRLDSYRLAKAPPRDKAGILREQVTTAPKTIAQIAAESGMSIADLIRSNASLARSPMVPAGTKVYTR